jgi:hypothetical protein
VIPQGDQEVVEDEGADNEEEAEAYQTMKRNRIFTRQIWNDNCASATSMLTILYM